MTQISDGPIRVISESLAQLHCTGHSGVSFSQSDRETALQVAFQLFGEYNLKLSESIAPGELMSAVCNLYDACWSGLCAVHELGAWGSAASGGGGGAGQQRELQESIAKCIIGGLRSEEAAAKKRAALSWWREGVLRSIAKRGQGPVGQPELPAAEQHTAQEGVLKVHEAARMHRMLVKVQATMLKIEREAHLEVLALLIEWGLTAFAKEALHDAGEFLTQDLLNHTLHVAILHDRWEIVTHLFGLGASLSLYESKRPELAAKADHRLDPLPARSVWKELLQHAMALGDGHEERSLIAFMTSVGALQKQPEQVPPREEISEDDALKALDLVYQKLLFANEDGGQQRAYFVSRRDGSRLEPDYILFMCMLISNRRELARVFFNRLATQNTAILLPHSLLASMLCKNLSAKVGSSSHHLKNDLEKIAVEYEEFAAKVLSIAYSRNEKGAINALEKPLKQYPKWTCIDVIMKAKCRKVIETCPDMCIAAVNRRFTGGGDIAAAIARLNQGFAKTLTFDDAKTRYGPKLGGRAPWKRLAICFTIDSMRIMHYLFNIFPSALMMLWAPITAVLNYNLFGNLFLSGFAVIEEFLPMLDMLPTTTLAWFYLGQAETTKDENSDLEELQERPYAPMDDFILEVMVHCLNSYVMTVFILMAPSPLTFAMEVAILLLLIGDVVADVIFAGIEEDAVNIFKCIKQGWQELFEDNG